MQTFRKLPTARPSSDEDRSCRGIELTESRPGSSGIGKSGDCSETVTRPVAGSSSYGVPDGSTGMPRQHVAARSAPAHEYGSPAAGGNRLTTASS